MAIESSSAMRRRSMAMTRAAGDTCSRWPTRAPAGTVSNERTRLPGRMPRRRMSSENEVMVSGSAILGSAT